MAIEHIAANLHRLRKASNLNMQDMANKCGLSRVAYSNIENSKSQPKSANLIRFAKVLDVDIKDIIADPPEFKSLRFRTNRRLTKQEENLREQIIYNVDQWLKDYNYLQELLKMAALDFPEIAEKDPVKVANKLRKMIGLGTMEPVTDVIGLLEKWGIKFHLSAFGLKNFFGFSIGQQDGGPAIAVNISEEISIERRIFTVVHELGHLLMHSDSYDQKERNEMDSEEREANIFAGYFLMPKEGFQREWEESKGLHWVDVVLHIKRKYRVSYKTVLYRFISHFNLDQGKVYPQFTQAVKKKYKISLKNHYEPMSLAEDKEKEPDPLSSYDFVEDRLYKMVREAYEKEEISLNRAAEILKLSLDEIRELNNSWKVCL